MKTHRIVLAIVAVICISQSLRGQSQHANSARGFNANGVYSGFDVDSINHFNGNLIVTIPIGQSYPTNGSLSYSLKLVYNSFIWSHETVCEGRDQSGFSNNYDALTSIRRVRMCFYSGAWRSCQDEFFEDVYDPPLLDPSVLVDEGRQFGRDDICQSLTAINPSSNAGIGWQMHLGKLFRPVASITYAQPVDSEKLYEVYQAPDGSEHQFFTKLHQDDLTDNADYFYTRDSSYLRMWKNPTPANNVYDSNPASPFNPANDSYRIEFPNGDIHHFQRVQVQDSVTWNSDGVTALTLPYYEDKIVRIEDRFGNFVRIDYYDDTTDGDSLPDNKWEIRDSVGRLHTVNFIKSGPLTLISSINMQTVGGAYDTYTLNYATNISTSIAMPHAWPDFFPGYNTGGVGDRTDVMLLPYLTSVRLPDNSQYSMPMNPADRNDPSNAYLPDIQRAGALAPGALVKLELPTGGHIEWEYHLPNRQTDDGYGYYFSPGISGRNAARVAPGIRKRRVYTGPGQDTLLGTWSYDPHIGNITHDGCSWVSLSVPCGAYQIMNRVTQPTGDYTDYFFSVYPHPGPGSHLEGREDSAPHQADYGLPFTKSPVDVNGAPNIYPTSFFGKQLFLSSIVYGADHQIKRTNYVRYEGDTYAFTDGFGNTIDYNPRQVASLMVYNDDSNKYKGVQYFDFDGLGHYRRMETFGNIGKDTRVEITNYNPNGGTYQIDSRTNTRAVVPTFYVQFPEGSPWILDTYSYQLRSQDGQRAVTFFNFDSSNGSLLGKRTRKDIESDSTDYATTSPNQVPLTLGANDVLVQYNYVNGNVSSESYFGGERQAGLSTSVIFPALANSASEYKIDIGYQCQKPVVGQGTTSVVSDRSYRAGAGETTIKLIDNTIDCVTGLPTAIRDTAGVETIYEYGVMSRLRFIKNYQGSYDEIAYAPHVAGVNNGRARVTVSHRAHGAISGATMAEEIYIYDELGRLATEKKRQPAAATYQARFTNYNAVNWVTAVSEWTDEGATPDGKTTRSSNFDAFGRAGRIEQPDGKVITVGYDGDRQITRSVNIGYQLLSLTGPVAEQNSTTKEVYDRHGRLVQLTEPSGAAGQNTTWVYWYNVNNKLGGASVVDASVSGAGQNRAFGYDNLGNLRTQSLPEVPWSQFSDYDTMGNVGTSYDGKHWLKYFYDSKARLNQVQELDEPVWQWRTLKSYSYYNANDVDANGASSPGNRGKGKMASATRNNRVGNPYEVLNVAAGKTATQSSTWGGLAASTAVDGSTNGNFFSHTDYNNQAWWQVDLGASYALEQIKVWSRTDCCQERLSNFYVLVSDDPFVSTDLTTARNQPGVSSYFVSGQAGVPTNVNVWRTGRYVRVQLTGANYLTLSEVQAMASSVNLYDIGVTEQYTYNGRDGRLGRQITKLNPGGPKPYVFDQSFTYDDIGNLTSQSYPQCTNPTCASPSQTGGSRSRPWTVNYHYTQGWLTSVGWGTSETNYAPSITYNPNGSLQSITHINNVVDTWGQDPNYMQRPASIDVRPSGAATPYWNSGTYKFDGAGNITRIGNDWYLYDKVSRVVEGSAYVVGMKKKYGYDGFGNILTVTTYAGVTTPTNGFQNGPVFNSNTRSDKNQYTLNYDGAGNTLGVLGAVGQPTPPPVYLYDGMNMIKSVPGSFTAHLYGPDDERVWTLRKQPGSPGVVTETITLRGLDNEVLREYQVNNGDELNQWQWAKDYIYAGNRLLAAGSPAGGLRHYHLDHLGTPRVITTETGSALNTVPYTYFPFGDEATAEPPVDERLRFTGHERDLNDPFRLDYMHARFYFRGGSAGKFMSVDPGRDWDPKQPQSWNLYSYVKDDPIGSTDPTGRQQALNLGQNSCSLSPVDAVLAVTPSHRNATSRTTIELVLKEAKAAGLSASQTAVILANAYHESHLGNDPVEIWNPKQVPWQRSYDHKNGNTRAGEGYMYRGQGDLMTTGTDGFVKLGTALNLGLDLYFHPEKTIDPVVSARGAVVGTMQGLYTGKKLDTYVNSTKTDFFNARSIINGDKKWNGRKIERYAQAYERALLTSGWPK